MIQKETDVKEFGNAQSRLGVDTKTMNDPTSRAGPSAELSDDGKTSAIPRLAASSTSKVQMGVARPPPQTCVGRQTQTRR
jgi:hypothetical protein